MTAGITWRQAAFGNVRNGRRALTCNFPGIANCASPTKLSYSGWNLSAEMTS